MRRLIIAAALILALASQEEALGIGLPAGTQIELLAGADYTDDLDQVRSAVPAAARLTVLQVAGVRIDTDTAEEAGTRGEDIYIPLTITNTGNGIDIFDLSTHSAQGWGAAIVYDDDADGVHQSSEQWVITDTGPIVADGYCPCFARLSVPAEAPYGDNITVTATSRLSPAGAIDTQMVSVSLPALVATGLSARAAPESLCAGQTFQVTGTLTPAMQKNLDIRITDPSGSASSVTVQTNQDGTFTRSFTTAQAGTYQIRVSFAGGAGYIGTSTTVSMQAVPRTSTSVNLVPLDESVIVGESVGVTGTLSPAMAEALTITCTRPNGSVTSTQVSADTQGRFQWSVQCDAAGQWLIHASYAGNECFTSSSRNLIVPAAAHTVAISAGPSANPSAVASAGQVQCSVTASDTGEHGLQYHWSDNGGSGSFSPSANVQNPTYTARSNVTGSDISVTLTCAVTCSSDSNVTDTGEARLTVHSIPVGPPEVLAAAPEDQSSCMALNSDLVVRFDREMSRSATEQAVMTTPALDSPRYTWTAGGTILTISQDALMPETLYSCAVNTGAKDAAGRNLTQAVSWAFFTKSGYEFGASEISATTGENFTTPALTLTGAELGSTVTAFIGVPEAIEVDATSVRGSLVCVEPGDDISQFSSNWDSAQRQIVVTARIETPGTAQVVKWITLLAPAETGVHQVLVNECPALTVRIRPEIPGDFDSTGAVTITDASLFVVEWTQRHQPGAPPFNRVTDGIYDLAPRTAGVWPDWRPLGNDVINIDDAAAFIQCWIGAHTGQSLSVQSERFDDPIRLAAVGETIEVLIDEAPDGVFRASVDIPVGAGFLPSVGRNGNLVNVSRGPGAGNFFFSEYNAATRTVNVTGKVSGMAPYKVAFVHLGG